MAIFKRALLNLTAMPPTARAAVTAMLEEGGAQVWEIGTPQTIRNAAKIIKGFVGVWVADEISPCGGVITSSYLTTKQITDHNNIILTYTEGNLDTATRHGHGAPHLKSFAVCRIEELKFGPQKLSVSFASNRNPYTIYIDVICSNDRKGSIWMWDTLKNLATRLNYSIKLSSLAYVVNYYKRKKDFNFYKLGGAAAADGRRDLVLATNLNAAAADLPRFGEDDKHEISLTAGDFRTWTDHLDAILRRQAGAVDTGETKQLRAWNNELQMLINNNEALEREAVERERVASLASARPDDKDAAVSARRAANDARRDSLPERRDLVTKIGWGLLDLKPVSEKLKTFFTLASDTHNAVGFKGRILSRRSDEQIHDTFATHDIGDNGFTMFWLPEPDMGGGRKKRRKRKRRKKGTKKRALKKRHRRRTKHLKRRHRTCRRGVAQGPLDDEREWNRLPPAERARRETASVAAADRRRREVWREERARELAEWERERAKELQRRAAVKQHKAEIESVRQIQNLLGSIRCREEREALSACIADSGGGHKKRRKSKRRKKGTKKRALKKRHRRRTKRPKRRRRRRTRR